MSHWLLEMAGGRHKKTRAGKHRELNSLFENYSMACQSDKALAAKFLLTNKVGEEAWEEIGPGIGDPSNERHRCPGSSDRVQDRRADFAPGPGRHRQADSTRQGRKRREKIVRLDQDDFWLNQPKIINLMAFKVALAVNLPGAA